MQPTAHPLLPLLLAAADGDYPPADGGVTYLPALPRRQQAVVSFTAHTVICSGLSADLFTDLALDGYGRALTPDVLIRLAAAAVDPVFDVLDVTLVARGIGGGALTTTSELDDHPRVRHARATRDDVRVHADGRGLVTLSRGLAGRIEMSVEVHDPDAGGAGRSLIAEALRLVQPCALVFAAVSPGNARSLRAFLAMGFAPICSELLIHSGPLTDRRRSTSEGTNEARG